MIQQFSSSFIVKSEDRELVIYIVGKKPIQ